MVTKEAPTKKVAGKTAVKKTAAKVVAKPKVAKAPAKQETVSKLRIRVQASSDKYKKIHCQSFGIYF